MLGQASTGLIGSAGPGTPNRLLFVGGATAEPVVAALAAPPCWQTGNSQRLAIRDRATGYSWIGVVGCGGKASRASRVSVAMTGGRRGDYQIDLIGPNGRAYGLKSANSRDRGARPNASYRVDLARAAPKRG